MTTVTIEETAPTGALVLAGDPFTEPELQALGARESMPRSLVSTAPPGRRDVPV
ncbi:hypothetical protein [Micrococcus luteus]|uniref:hypothetical protein n=1 Tax=Micrococcus luteus TaxID=1270 RepID=UPI000AC34FA6|nr:hypothetical protein [Micrococcus luteus]